MFHIVGQASGLIKYHSSSLQQLPRRPVGLTQVSTGKVCYNGRVTYGCMLQVFAV